MSACPGAVAQTMMRFRACVLLMLPTLANPNMLEDAVVQLVDSESEHWQPRVSRFGLHLKNFSADEKPPVLIAGMA